MGVRLGVKHCCYTTNRTAQHWPLMAPPASQSGQRSSVPWPKPPQGLSSALRGPANCRWESKTEIPRASKQTVTIFSLIVRNHSSEIGHCDQHRLHEVQPLWIAAGIRYKFATDVSWRPFIAKVPTLQTWLVSRREREVLDGPTLSRRYIS